MMYIKSKKAQAILELAIFGSIILMLLGIILNYGLRYGLQQKVMMSAFRKTLAASTDSNSGGQGSYTLIQDKHIPNPSNPFAVGSVAPFSAGGSVVRTARLHETADTEAELPRTTIQIQDRKFPYKTAGFRDVHIDYITEYDADGNVISSTPGPALDKYKEIYGDTNVWEEPEGSGNYRVIDSCEGEIISFDGCKRQCRMITQVDYCESQCERGKLPGSDTDCNAICNQSIETPWYCDNLDNIFDFAIAANKPKRMGVQSDYTKQTAMNNTLRKQEQDGIITTTDSINWSDTTNRTIVYIDQEHNVQQAPVSTTVGENTCPICGWTGSKKELVDGHKCPKCGAEIPQL